MRVYCKRPSFDNWIKPCMYTEQTQTIKAAGYGVQYIHCTSTYFLALQTLISGKSDFFVQIVWKGLTFHSFHPIDRFRYEIGYRERAQLLSRGTSHPLLFCDPHPPSLFPLHPYHAFIRIWIIISSGTSRGKCDRG